MATKTMSTTITFEETSCSVCGVYFALEATFDSAIRRSHETFWCPRGHALVFGDQSEEERLKRELEQARQATARTRERLAEELAAHEATERRRRAAKGQLTKTRNRLRAGLCPDCNQHFPDLEIHAQTEHPHEPAATLAEVEE